MVTRPGCEWCGDWRDIVWLRSTAETPGGGGLPEHRGSALEDPPGRPRKCLTLTWQLNEIPGPDSSKQGPDPQTLAWQRRKCECHL
ncbi:hypothetical protein NDU88_000872 [Pleurodeles waltl]|uniref:Uncharacterized protein n=1 Tax=Pleurodeles waltl TaxID=8319 RepID=A0AAV7VXT0_PLEWA|nr:hypothetical protein NDU88_000872 [Pleurodeles waltl]